MRTGTWLLCLLFVPLGASAYTPDQVCGTIRDDDDKSLERICQAVIHRDQAICRRIDKERHPRHRLFCEVTYPFVLDKQSHECQSIVMDASNRARRLGIGGEPVEAMRDRILLCKAMTLRDQNLCVRAPTSDEKRACITTVEALRLLDEGQASPSPSREVQELRSDVRVPVPSRAWTPTEAAHVAYFVDHMAPSADIAKERRMSNHPAKKVATAFSLSMGPGGANRASVSARWLSDDLMSFLDRHEGHLLDAEAALAVFRDVEQLARLTEIQDYMRDALVRARDPRARSVTQTMLGMFSETLADELMRTGRLALPTGYTQDNGGHATATVLAENSKGGGAARVYNAGSGAEVVSGGPSGPGVQRAVLRFLSDLRCDPPRAALGPETELEAHLWNRQHLKTLLEELLSHKVLGVAGEDPGEETRRTLTRAGGTEGREVPSTKPQSAGNCTHKNPMNMIKGTLDPTDYLLFKGYMRQRRLVEYRESLPASQRDRDPLLLAAEEKHEAWKAKDRSD